MQLKLPFTRRHGVLLIAAANLAVAVTSVVIHTYANLDRYRFLSENVFDWVGFPLLLITRVAYGDINFLTGRTWVFVVFCVLLVLNATLWGFAGVHLAGWLRRTFWGEPEHMMSVEEADLKRRLRRTISLHVSLLFPLLLLLRVLFPEGLGGFLPPSLHFLNFGSYYLFGPGFGYSIPLWGLLLWLDARTYRHLYFVHGRRAADRWSRVIVICILAVFVAFLFLMGHACCQMHGIWDRH